jgi:hypothetical protein
LAIRLTVHSITMTVFETFAGKYMISSRLIFLPNSIDSIVCPLSCFKQTCATWSTSCPHADPYSAAYVLASSIDIADGHSKWQRTHVEPSPRQHASSCQSAPYVPYGYESVKAKVCAFEATYSIQIPRRYGQDQERISPRVYQPRQLPCSHVAEAIGKSARGNALLCHVRISMPVLNRNKEKELVVINLVHLRQVGQVGWKPGA